MVSENTKKYLIKLYDEHNILLEGNILKVIIKEEEDLDFKKYIETCIKVDKEKRVKRLEITKQVQKQNTELSLAKVEIERINQELVLSLNEAKKAKDVAESDLTILQQKTQFELISIIVKIALAVIISVAFITTLMYIVAIIFNRETQIVGSTWSNLFGILLTNSFSIIGTIMGFKHINKNENPKSDEK
jgi:hypothetical protein